MFKNTFIGFKTSRTFLLIAESIRTSTGIAARQATVTTELN